MVNTTIVASTAARGTTVPSCADLRPKAVWVKARTGAFAGIGENAAEMAVAPGYAAGSRHGSGLAFTTLATTDVMSDQSSRIDDVQGNRLRGPAPV